ncbi:MAG: hypothetical protein HYX97_01855 [Chloroflexi bacterium]|nr:hypothetical protein [Chloroflexota bacterium]
MTTYHVSRGTALKLRASDLAAIFEVFLLAVAVGSLKTALDLTQPWYNATASFWAYATTFVGSIVLLSVMAMAAVVLARPRAFEQILEASSAESVEKAAEPTTVPAETEMDEILKFLKRAASSDNPERGRSAVGQTVEVSAVQAPGEVAPRLRRSRRVLTTFVGPSITATVFAGISAAFLPSADGFLQTFFTLNTFMILTFAYGWVGLLAYSVSSIFLAASDN